MPYLAKDRELLNKFRQGDEQALEEVYNQYRGSLLSMLKNGFEFKSKGSPYRFKGYSSSFDILDVIQEAFLRAFSEDARLKYDGIAPFGAYLRQIARNIVIDHFRRKMSERRFEKLTSIQSSDAPDQVKADQEENLLKSEINLLVNSFINELEEIDQNIIKIYFKEKNSQEFTAKSLGINRNDLRKRIQIIRKKLIKFFKREKYPIFFTKMISSYVLGL